MKSRSVPLSERTCAHPRQRAVQLPGPLNSQKQHTVYLEKKKKLFKINFVIAVLVNHWIPVRMSIKASDRGGCRVPGSERSQIEHGMTYGVCGVYSRVFTCPSAFVPFGAEFQRVEQPKLALIAVMGGPQRGGRPSLSPSPAGVTMGLGGSGVAVPRVPLNPPFGDRVCWMGVWGFWGGLCDCVMWRCLLGAPGESGGAAQSPPPALRSSEGPKSGDGGTGDGVGMPVEGVKLPLGSGTGPCVTRS